MHESILPLKSGYVNNKNNKNRLTKSESIPYARLLPERFSLGIYSFALFLVFLNLSHFHSPNLQRQTKQCDEAACVVVVVQIAGGKACQ